jgi:glycosyltransferase involved in cell wall biosynthesis
VSRAIRIAIDLTPLMAHRSGVDRYLTDLVLHLGQVDARNHYDLFLNVADRDQFAGRLPRNFQLWPVAFRPRPARLLFQQTMLPAICAFMGVDVVHSPSFLMPCVRGRQRHLLTVHDMTMFSMPHVHSRLHGSLAFRRFVSTSIRRAHMINVPSRATRDALLDRLPEIPPEKVQVTGFGVSSSFRPARAADVSMAKRRLGLPEQYFLFVGNIEPRKNLDVLLESYRVLLANDPSLEDLVLAGRLCFGFEPLLERIDAWGLRGRVHVRGFAAEDDLPWLYRGARVFVYPSLAEGFGFPPLEAMACGIPVASTLGSSLEENLSGAADLVPPGDVAALAAAMRRLSRDEDRRQQRIEAGLRRVAAFGWQSTARDVLECYRRLARGWRPELADPNRAGASSADEADHRAGSPT